MSDTNDHRDGEATLRGLADPLLNLARDRAEALLSEIPDGARGVVRAIGTVAAGPVARATQAAVSALGHAILDELSSDGESLPEVDVTLHGARGWRARAARVDESLCALYEVTLDVAHRAVDVDPAALLGTRLRVVFSRGDVSRAWWCTVRRVEHAGFEDRQRLARVHCAPAFWSLTQRRDLRVFQDMTAVEVTLAVLREAGFAEERVAVRLTTTPPSRSYCVQHRESDLDFVSRLLAEEGATWMIEQGSDGEVMALVDHPSGWGTVATYEGAPVTLAGPDGGAQRTETVRSFEAHRELRPTSVTLRDYDDTRPAHDLTRRASGGEPGERAVYDHPARYTFTRWDEGASAWGGDSGDRAARVAWEREVTASEGAEGAGNVTGFMPGLRFVVQGYEGPRAGEKWVLTRVRHEAHAPEVLARDARRDEGRDRYRNRFACAPADAPWRPELPPRPRVQGLQTAVVVGPEGEEIYTDAHGRVKVQFHWDRRGARDARSSCWIRVAQSLAGEHFGALHIPRVGMEVLVDFIDGDPDRPVVVGAVYNRLNPPPESLPEHRTRTTLRTRSTPGGEGYNELRFEDRAGAEEVHLRAQRDLDENVLREHRVSVGADERVSVGHDQSTAVSRDRSVTVGRDETHTVGHDARLTVVNDRTVRVGHNEVVQVANDQTIEVVGCLNASASNVVVSAGTTMAFGTPSEAMAVHVHGGRVTEVRGGDRATIDQRVTRVEGPENLYVGSLWIQQGDSKLMMFNDVTEIEGGGPIRIFRQEASIDIFGDGKISLSSPSEVSLKVGGATLTLKPDGVELSFGGNHVKIDATGVTTHGALVTLD